MAMVPAARAGSHRYERISFTLIEMATKSRPASAAAAPAVATKKFPQSAMSGSLAHLDGDAGLDGGPHGAPPLLGRGAVELVGRHDALDHVGHDRDERAASEADRDRGGAVVSPAEGAVAAQDPGWAAEGGRGEPAPADGVGEESGRVGEAERSGSHGVHPADAV
jgi:hypothetical protein